MTGYLWPVLYVVVCALAAYFGRNTRLGYWGTFVVSLIFTPFLVVIILLLFGQGRQKGV
jgi:hypothetical protein